MQHKRQKRRPVSGSQENRGQLGFATSREKGEYIWLGGWSIISINISRRVLHVCLPGIISDELDRHQQILLSFMSLVPTTYKCYFSILKPHPLKSTIISTLKLLD